MLSRPKTHKPCETVNSDFISLEKKTSGIEYLKASNCNLSYIYSAIKKAFESCKFSNRLINNLSICSSIYI